MEMECLLSVQLNIFPVCLSHIAFVMGPLFDVAVHVLGQCVQ